MGKTIKDEFGSDSIAVEIVILEAWSKKIRDLTKTYIGAGDAPEIKAFNRLASQIESYIPVDRTNAFGEQLTPCEATLTFIHDINEPTNEKARFTTGCSLFKEHHKAPDGTPFKHLSLAVQATLGGEQFDGTEGWSFRVEKAY